MDGAGISALVNLGAAGAVIIVVFYFLKHMKEEAKNSRDFFGRIHDSDVNAIDRLTTALNNLTEIVGCLRSEVKDHDEKVEQRIQAVERSHTPARARKE
jgi:hypothetical protein